MRSLTTLFLLAAAPASAQLAPVTPAAAPALPAPLPSAWNPAADYVTAGQDEPGYRSWYLAAPWRAAQVRSFNAYLGQHGVAGIVPTWQLLRTATSWRRCGGEPFEVPPASEWPHIVQTLRYVHAHVIPAIGPVEPVSAYRNPTLNVCAGGAPESAHKHYSAIDLVPLRPTTREELMHKLCAVHARRGGDYAVGLGFYAFLRFHVDTVKYRRWGSDLAASSCPPIIRPVDVASVAQPAPADPAAAIGAKTVYAPAASEQPQPAPAATAAAAPPTAPDQKVPQPQH